MSLGLLPRGEGLNGRLVRELVFLDRVDAARSDRDDLVTPHDQANPAVQVCGFNLLNG